MICVINLDIFGILGCTRLELQLEQQQQHRVKEQVSHPPKSK